VTQAARAAALHPGHSLLSHERIQRWLKRTPLLNTWTVNEPNVAQFLSKAGVNALISDTPGVILKAISSASF
jgi:glycerophosphoryl diester phosphodiesterase